MKFSDLEIGDIFTIGKGNTQYKKMGYNFAHYISVRNSKNKRTENSRTLYFEQDYNNITKVK